MRIAESELILRPNGAIYHLDITPSQMCNQIITVGDPKRVGKVSAFFDHIDYQTENREIVIHKGSYKNKDLMVLSTGMGTDNIDIVLNELDALVNIDFETREIKSHLTSLHIIRIGTSGSIQSEIDTGSFVYAKHAIGFDGLLYFYKNSDTIRNTILEAALYDLLPMPQGASIPYVVEGSKELQKKFEPTEFISGNTLTLNGFYAPQGRELRMPLSSPKLNYSLESFEFQGEKITNLEMESSAIYGLSALMGHQAISANLILANRIKGTFLEDYSPKMNEMIDGVLEII